MIEASKHLLNQDAHSALLFSGERMNSNAPKRIRIAVYGLKGRCPRPLDDGGMLIKV